MGGVEGAFFSVACINSQHGVPKINFPRPDQNTKRFSIYKSIAEFYGEKYLYVKL